MLTPGAPAGRPVRLSASIMAHPDRAQLVATMQDQMAGDSNGHLPVSWDREGKPSGRPDRAWRNARTAWLMHNPAADWHVLIQDDALLCDDFLVGLAQALSHVPARATVSAYLGSGPNVTARWGRMAVEADRVSASWVRSYQLMWGVCVAVPVAMIPEMLTWGDRKAGVPDDMRVSGFFKRQQVDTWYTWPSLADHRAGPSISGHRHVNRVAVRHHQGSALAIDWAGPTVLDPMIARKRGPRSGPIGSWRRGRA